MRGAIAHAVRCPAVHLYNAYLGWRSSRERSVKNIAVKNNVKAFDAIYRDDALVAEYLSEDRRAFYEEVAAVVADLDPRRVVDLGCGTGHLLAAVLSRCPEVIEAVGVDNSFQAIRRLRQSVPWAHGVVASLYESGLPAGTYDVVLCTEVLEHVRDPERALRVLARLCASGGAIVVTVPDGEHDTFEGHVNFWSESAFSELLQTVGAASVNRTAGGDLIAVVSPDRGLTITVRNHLDPIRGLSKKPL